MLKSPVVPSIYCTVSSRLHVIKFPSKSIKFEVLDIANYIIALDINECKIVHEQNTFQHFTSLLFKNKPL